MLDLKGTALLDAEHALLQYPQVGGVILFTRNFESPDQIAALVADIRKVRAELLVAVDHEGGRVQRFREGFVRLPPARSFGTLHDVDPERDRRFEIARGVRQPHAQASGGGHRPGDDVADPRLPRVPLQVLHERVRAERRPRPPRPVMPGPQRPVRPEHARPVLEAFRAAGFRTKEANPAWLFKAMKDRVLVDLIFVSAGGVLLDGEMVTRARHLEVEGFPVPVIPAEDLVVIKALVHKEHSPRHWFDALALLRRDDLDWDYLVRRARQHGPLRVLSLLYYARSNDQVVPAGVIAEVLEAARKEVAA